MTLVAGSSLASALLYRRLWPYPGTGACRGVKIDFRACVRDGAAAESAEAKPAWLSNVAFSRLITHAPRDVLAATTHFPLGTTD